MWEEKRIPSIIVMKEDEYHDLNYCSYSFLSKLDRSGYRAFSALPLKGKALNLGSFIDCYVLTPEELDDRFALTLQDYTASKKTLADHVIENYETVPSTDDLYSITRGLGLWTTRKETTVLSEFDEDFLTYLKKSIESKDKTFYTTDDLILANTCRDSLYNSHLTELIFRPDEFGTTVLFQTKGLFEFDELHIKFMVDILVIDPILKKIYVYDLKTGEKDLDSFESSFLEYRYDIQHYLYTKGVDAIKEELGYKDYTVEPLKFIYLYKKQPEVPVIYEVPDIDIYNGYTTKYGYQMTGVKQLIDDYKFYNGGYVVPRRVAEGKGIVTLNI